MPCSMDYIRGCIPSFWNVSPTYRFSVYFCSIVFILRMSLFFKSLYWIYYHDVSVLCFGFFGHKTCGILAPQPGIELTLPVLEDEVLTIGPAAKSLPLLNKVNKCLSQWKERKKVKLLGRVQLCDPVDCSLSGSSIPGILQARILGWVAIFFSRESSQPRDRTCVFHMAGRCFNLRATREPYTLTPFKTLVFIASLLHFKFSFCRKKSLLKLIIDSDKDFEVFFLEMKLESYFLFVITLRQTRVEEDTCCIEIWQYIIRTCFIWLNYSLKQNV